VITLGPGESLAGALVRLAADTVTTPLDLAREADLNRRRGRGGQVRDGYLDAIDWPAAADVSLLGRWFRCEPAAVRAATLWRYKALPGIQENLDPSDPMWRERRSHRFWVTLERDRYCPACLDESPIFLLAWRLRPLTVCPRHALLLRDACHACGSPRPLQAYLGRRQPLIAPAWSPDPDDEEYRLVRWAGWPDVARHCGSCGADLAAGAATPVAARTVEYFAPLLAAIAGEIPAGAPAALHDPQQYLAAGNQLARMLLASARRGYGDPSCVALFRDGTRPATHGAAGDGILADVADAHVQSLAMLAALRGWPASLHALDRAMRDRDDHNLLGVGERYPLPEVMTEELRRTTGRATRALLEIDLGRHALGGEPGPPLRADEFLRLLAPLWPAGGGAPPLALRDAAETDRRTTFPPHATLRRVGDALLAGIEGDATIPPERDCPPDLLRAFRDRWDHDPAFAAFLAVLRDVAADRRDDGPDAPSAIFIDPPRPGLGLTDRAWLWARPHLPAVTLAARLGARTGRPLDWRGLLGQIAARVCAVPGDIPSAGHLTGKLAATDEGAVWRALRALVDLAGEPPEGGATIARPLLTDAAWAAADLAALLAPPAGRGRPTATTPRQVLETLLDSWLTSESVAATAALARTGIAHRTGPMMDWPARWLASGALVAALDALAAVEPDPTRVLLYRLVRGAAGATDAGAAVVATVPIAHCPALVP